MQQIAAAAPKSEPQVAITSPADGAALANASVDVSFASGKGGGKRVDRLELRANGQLVGSFDVPAGTTDGSHSFLSVNLAPVAGAGGAVTLMARALLGNPGKKFVDSAPVHVTVPVLGDAIAPTITGLVPAQDSATNKPRPALSAQVSDTGGSGVDPSSIVLTIDGLAPISPTLTQVNADLFTLSFTPAADLAEGTHSFIVNAADKAGNPATTASSSFRVDATPPSIPAFSPADGSLLTTSTPTIKATIQDTGGAGLVATGTTLLLNGVLVPVVVTPPGITNTLSLTFTPVLPLTDGPQAAVIQTSDRAGNSFSVGFTFTTDITPPLISIVSPAGGSALSAAAFPVSINISDAGTGIATSSVVVLLNGNPVTPMLTVSPPTGVAGAVTVTGGLTAGPGTNTLQVSASDVVGLATTTLSSFSFSSASDITVVPAPSFVVDVTKVSAQPLVQEDLPPESGVDAQAWTNRPIMVKVLLTAGGQPVEGVEIKPVVTSGEGSFFFTPAYPRVSKDDGTAGFGFLCPQKPGYTEISVTADVIQPGSSVSYKFKANLVDAHLILVGDFPGSGCYASVSAPTGIGRATVVVDEVDDQGDVISDASQQRLTIFSRIYVTNSRGLLHIPLQLNSNASGTARLRIAYPEFRDIDGKLLTFTDAFDIDHFLSLHPPARRQGQLRQRAGALPGEGARPAHRHHPSGRHRLQPPSEVRERRHRPERDPGRTRLPRTVEPIDGQLVLNESDPNKKAFTAIVTNPNGTLSVRYSADPSGVGATLVVDGGVRSSSGPAPALNPADRVVIREPEIRIVSDDTQEHLAGVPTVPLDQFLSEGAPTAGKVHYEVRIPRSGVGSDSVSLALQALQFDGTDVPSDDTTPPASRGITLTQSSPDVYVSKSMIFMQDRRVVESVPTGGDFEIVYAGSILRPTLNLAAPAQPQQARQPPLMTLRSDPRIPERSDSTFAHGLVNNRANVMDRVPAKARITIWLNPSSPGERLKGLAPTIVGRTDPASGPSLGQFILPDGPAGPNFSRPASEVNRIQYEFDPANIPADQNGVETVLQFRMQQSGIPENRATVSLPIRFSRYNRVVVGYYYLATDANDTPTVGRRPTAMDLIGERHRLAKQIWAQNGIDLVSEEELGGKNGIVLNPSNQIPVDTLRWVDDSAVPANNSSQVFVRNLMAKQQQAAAGGFNQVPQLFVFFIDTLTISNFPSAAGLVPNTPPVLATAANGQLAAFKPNFAVVLKGMLKGQSVVPGPNHAVVAHELGHCFGLGDTVVGTFNDNLMHQGDHDANRLEIGVNTQVHGNNQNQFLRSAEVASFLK